MVAAAVCGCGKAPVEQALCQKTEVSVAIACKTTEELGGVVEWVGGVWTVVVIIILEFQII